MNLHDILERIVPAAPWADGENIPWNDPEFSRRMLREHLSQDHSMASRKLEAIDRQVEWIHEQIPGGTPTRILDLACGPGLYTSRLAKRGHDCVGIDYAPAAIEHARRVADAEGLSCAYLEADVREAAYGEEFGLVMMLFGQINVFRRDEARDILRKAFAALSPGGMLLLEAQKFETVERAGATGPSWSSSGEGGGLFSESPHLLLTESFWDPGQQASTQRFFVVDAGSGEVTRHALTTVGYQEEEYRELLDEAGFRDVRTFPSLVGREVEAEAEAANLAILAQR